MELTTDFSRESVRLRGKEHIWVPLSSGRAAAAGLSLFSPSRPAVVLVQRVLFGAVRVLGPWVLPGSRDSWSDLVPPMVWEVFMDEWRSLFGPWDSVALYCRPERHRSGFAILVLRDGRGVGFVRVSTSEEAVRKEFGVMSGVHLAHPKTFHIARPLAWGEVEGWAWLATESIPNYPLGAVRRARVRAGVTREIGDILDDVLLRSPDTPAHWRGSHGDLSPWNLRTELRGAVRVIDWEDACFAPPGADALYGALTAYVTFGTRPRLTTSRETAAWLADAISARRRVGEDEGSVNNRLLAALARVPISS